jgi:CitB family two-component system sensor histidine kinase MalK
MFTRGMSTRGENRGYGLYLVERIIEKRNGSIEIISDLGTGTTFIVELPYTSKTEQSSFMNRP